METEPLSEKLLKDILKWHKIIGIEVLKKKVRDEGLFEDPAHILVYQYSDGENSIRDLEKMAKVSKSTVQNLWKKWIAAGIAEPTGKYKGGRCIRLFELHELGLELPK